MLRPKRRDRSTRAASLVIRSCTPVGRNKFLNPARDGAVLPVLHLNGYKIANPTVLARIEPGELRSLLEGYGYGRGSWRGQSQRRCTSRWPPPSTRCST